MVRQEKRDIKMNKYKGEIGLSIFFLVPCQIKIYFYLKL